MYKPQSASGRLRFFVAIELDIRKSISALQKPAELVHSRFC